MNQFLKGVATFLFLVATVVAFAQSSDEDAMPLKPMFSVGTDYHTFQGDIMGPETNSLLGNIGYKAGMRLNISEKFGASLIFAKNSFYEKNDSEKFEANLDAIGIHLGYAFNPLFKKSRIYPYLTLGVQTIGFKTFNEANQDEWTDRESILAIPYGFGLRLDISERIDLDATLSYTIAMGDIDKSVSATSDKYMTVGFMLHYDLFAPSKGKSIFDDSYYADVNFKELDVEDEDGDKVADVDDYCPKTPVGVKVNEQGCPLDDDNDGIPNYIDQQKNTPKGAVVDEKGVQLTEEKYKSMYADIDAASREYANFYNESEIKRENYKTVDEYLIAKANAFNKAYNESLNANEVVDGLKYKVKIGAYKDGIPANVINKYLSFDDLESMPQDDGLVIYTVGSYATLEQAREREGELRSKGFNETTIAIDNNGALSDYIEPTPEPVIEEIVVDSSVTEAVIAEDTAAVETITEVATNETVYRVQIGAFKVVLSDEIFEGIDNVVSFKGKDDLIRYMMGSFVDYKEAVSNMHQMRARGFEDAFIVTYKNGERIGLSMAIKKERTEPKVKEVVFETEEAVEEVSAEYVVQVLVAKASLSVSDLNKMSSLGNVTKEAEGEDLFSYFAGVFSSLEEAEAKLAEAKKAGFEDAFIFTKVDGKRISAEEAEDLLR